MIGKTMRVGATMFALLVAANVAVAQGGGGNGGGGAMGGQRGGRGGEGMSNALLQGITLTDAVKAKVADVVKWYDEEAAKIPRGQRGAPPDTAAMAKRTALTADFRGKLKALLSPEQQKTFDENIAKMPQGGGRRGGGL
jgi:Spy/CpxP family protein refolding chaperone